MQRIWRSVMASVDDAPMADAEKKNRLHHYTVFILLGVPTMAGFGIYNIVKGDTFLSVLIFLSIFGLTAGWHLLTRLQDGMPIYRLNTIIYAVLNLYLLQLGGEGGSKILWLYLFPLIAFFLLGKREGLFWSTLIFAATVILLWFPLKSITVYPYADAFKIRFVLTYLFAMVITYWFEFFRHCYRVGMETEHQRLEEEQKRLNREIEERKKAERDKELLIGELQEALDKVKTLSGLLPICSHCHKIRDDAGYWNHLEAYIQDHSHATLSHGICPDCAVKLYPDIFKEKN